MSKSGVKSETLQGESKTSTTYIANLKEKKASSVQAETKISYRELIGCLLWISMRTRPDVFFIKTTIIS